MIPQKSRLPRDGFRAHGYRIFTTPYFSLKSKNNTLGINRIGVVVGKSVEKRATQRNFWERQAKGELLKAKNRSRDYLLTRTEFGKEIKKAISFFI
jgi:ribonuclease P protein component